nr:hypothetical protein [Tanacetum cinerariifolium]
MEDQPLPDDASPIALSPGYVVDFHLEEDPTDYPADGGDDDDDESSNDDDDEEEEQKGSEDDNKEKEEDLALANSSVVPVDDLIPLAEDTEAFETDERLVSREVSYEIEDVWDDMVRDIEERSPTTIEGLSKRVTDSSTTLARDTYKIHVRLKDAHDDRSL